MRKIVHCIFSEYPQREQTIESTSSFKGTVNPSFAQLGHLVYPLIFLYPKKFSSNILDFFAYH